MSTTPQLWHIYFVKRCTHTEPIKDKFVVIVYIGKNPMGFLINSKVTDWLIRRPQLLEAALEKHDS